MKNSMVLMFSLVFFLCLSGVAGAVPTEWTDLIDPEPDTRINWRNSSITYTHDITDGPNGFQGLLMGGDDIVTSYALTIALYDDADNKSEGAFINQLGWRGDGSYNFNYENNEFGWSYAGLAQLNLFGELTVTISRVFGDFYFDYSELVAAGDNGNGTAPVPEPTTMLLLGTGLVGMAGFRKKFQTK